VKHRHGRIISRLTFALFVSGAVSGPAGFGRMLATPAILAAAAVEEPSPASGGYDPQKPRPGQPPQSRPTPELHEPVPSPKPEPTRTASPKTTIIPGQTPAQAEEKKPAPSPTQAQPKAEQPATPPAATAAQAPSPQPVPSAPGVVSFRLENADMQQFIGLVAGELKLNYIVDPAVKGAVTINTAGELRREDLFPILQSVLKINGATAVRTGNFYRIIPSAQAAKSPLAVFKDSTGAGLPQDDRMVMEIIPLRFVFASDMAKVLTPFLTDSGVVAVHDAGNVLILVDTSLNAKRLMEIIEQFDSRTLAQQRIRLVPVQNNVASGLVPELESIFSAYALAEKATPIRFVPVDRINSILVVTPDPSAFDEVQKWIERLDQPAPPSGVQTFIYRVQNSEADYLARILTNIQGSQGTPSQTRPGAGPSPASAGAGAGPGATAMTREVGASASDVESGQVAGGRVRMTTDPVNNSLIIQSTAQQYSEILNTLKQLDVIPRQVMIEARVYEVTLTGNLSFGVEYFLQQRSSQERRPLASFSADRALQASAGTLIGQARELLGFLNASENRSRVRVLSAPTLLATDNSDARIQVGSEIPILTSQGVVPVQTGGSSLFTNTIQNRDTGIILTVTPRITSTGLVSLRITQEISSAQPASAGGIQSPSFLKRSITTRAVVGDSETIALGGLIQETVTTSRNRIPLLGDIPGLGLLFGSTSYTQAKTELIVLLTPHIVKNTEEARDVTRELREGLLDLRRSFKKEKFVNP